MVERELAQCLHDILLNLFGDLFRVGLVVRDAQRGEIGAVDRIVDGKRDLILVAVGDPASNTSPHRLQCWVSRCSSDDDVIIPIRTVRLAKVAVILGLWAELTLEESLLLTAADRTDWKVKEV